jgi:hypothetical protein
MLASRSSAEVTSPLHGIVQPSGGNLPTGWRTVDATSVESANGIGNNIITDPVIGSQEVGAGRSPKGPIAREPESWPAVKSQARALAVFIEGHSANLGAYIKLVRECDAQTILAAVIATLIRKHFPDGRGPLRRPGGYFTRRCQQFQCGSVSAEVAAWVERCGHLPYLEIDGALEAASRVRPRMGDHPPAHLQSTMPDEIPPPIYPPGRGGWMNRSEAEELVGRISREDPTVVVKQIQRVYLAAGEVHVVEVVIDCIPYAFSSARDWEDYRSRLRAIEEMGALRNPGKGW